MAKFIVTPNTGNWFKQADGSISGAWKTQDGEMLKIVLTEVDDEHIKGEVGACGSIKLGKRDSVGARIGEIIENDGTIVRVRSIVHRKDGVPTNVFLHALTNTSVPIDNSAF